MKLNLYLLKNLFNELEFNFYLRTELVRVVLLDSSETWTDETNRWSP